MVERREINLLYQHNDNWIGGTYYIINIVRALKVLEDNEKPTLYVYYDSEIAIKPIVDLQYPFIQFKFFTIRKNIFIRLTNRIFKDFFGRLLIKQKIDNGFLKNLYPVAEWIDTSNISQYYYWIPDFQERYLPKFFTKKEIWQRKQIQQQLVQESAPIIFSSKNAWEDFNLFYPNNTNKKEVLKFVSIIDDAYSLISITSLKEKFDIQRSYFICPNQFWQHKNHGLLIKAVKKLKDKGIDCLVVFTGKEYDHRNPNYVTELKKYIEEYNLSDNFRFLGFIDRNEQLQLMKNSIAIIQPSLFEGWSTVVEDTKALNHVLLLSDLPLHREQIDRNCIFFDPNDEYDLGSKIERVLKNGIERRGFKINLEQLLFAKKFVSLFD